MAMNKCGYCPSTRAALKATQIQHEVIEDEEGNIDETADPYGSLLNELEQQNEAACNGLLQQGYALADKLRRTPRRITAEQVRGRAAVKTLPNTRERQDAIMSISTAGGWFHVTNGGGPMTSDDALIAFARKGGLKRVEELEKRRKVTMA